MPLIGRRRELAAIARLLDRARTGAGGALVIAGPLGSGKTALADAAATLAESRGLRVTRTLPRPAEPPAAGGVAGRDAARLIVLDDADRGAWPDLSGVAGAVLLTTAGDAGHRPDLRLRPFTETELTELLAGLSPDAVHAVWLASAGWPGPALDLAAGLDGLGDRDAVAELALTTPSRAEFLILDVALIRLLESAATHPLPAETRARVLARLARELLGDPSAAARRRELGDEALALARQAGDPGTIAEVLDARLHALWDPAAAEERLATASEIVERARDAGDAAVERRGLFWRFVALAELGDLDAAEAALTAYARAGELDGDAGAGVVALSRQAMLAMIRGRFDLTDKLAEEVAAAGHQAGMADTDRLTATLRGWRGLLRGDASQEVPLLREVARRLPGHFFEATAARALAEAGRDAEALLELDRLLPSVLAGTGPRWIGAVADLALVASHGAGAAAVRQLYDALYPYRGRLVVWGGANMITGPVDDYLGRLAARLGEAVAMEHFDHAVAQEERLGALPWLARTLHARGRDGDKERADALMVRLYPEKSDRAEWRLVRDGDDWRLEAGPENVRLKDVRGLHYLRTLLAASGQEIPALDLVAGGAGLRVPPGEPVLDAAARAAFRDRLATLDHRLDSADRAGDVKAAQDLAAERAALVAELRRAGGFGGRPRRQSAESERARVNATRALQTVLTRLEAVAPLAAAHLRASLRTGNRFRYQPAPGGPSRWRV